MTFTSQDIILIIGALALATQNIINAWRTNSKIAAVDTKAETITGHVNGARTIAENKIDALRDEVMHLRKQVNDLTSAAALLAQAKSIADGNERL